MIEVHHTLNDEIVILDVIKYRKPFLRKVPKKINWATNKFERVFFPSKDEVLKSNDSKFIKWVIKQLMNTGKTLEESQNFNACALYLNEKNLQNLHDRLSPMVWLNYSPTTSTNLSDKILGINTKEVVVDV